MGKWQILKESDVSPSKWFPVLKHTVRLPNQSIIDDYFISPMGNVAMVLPVTINREIVLVKQYKHGLGEVVIELPAGFQQEGKTVEESALAELEEETGIRTTKESLTFLGKVANNPTKTFHVTHCYLAKDLEFNSSQNLEETEGIELVVVKPNELVEMIKAGDIWVADSIFAITMALFGHQYLFEC
jgi:8-oxo-dGTP pyrophosphatase MutT (NUDIX family)